MFFAAFERKWWKSIGKEQVKGEFMATDDKMDSPEGTVFDLNNEDPLGTPDSDALWDQVDHGAAGIDHIDSDTGDSNSSSGIKRSKDNNDNFSTGSSEISWSDESDEVGEDDEEIFTNISSDEAPEELDPLSAAYDLEEGNIIELGKTYDDDPTTQKTRSAVTTAKEFFNQELLYRFDLLREDEREQLTGRYRIEVRGTDGGVWTLSVDKKDINIVPAKEDADLVLMVQQDDFISVVNGYINPQIALASQRIKISGDPRKASLFQNVLAPRDN
ncbi:MAG TPA: SCP2 sterol-binding domain-containing protein [Oligoflexia bacterium]|nr:SCP2 sterol-binding domain-containing protein [Oligoflexia bacterium]HMP47668.1 SCP2 sterol-binding domain-containing protein [Oligoflexia bacterium]